MKLSSPEGTSDITVNGTGTDKTQYNIDGINDTTNDGGEGYARVNFIPTVSSHSELQTRGESL